MHTIHVDVHEAYPKTLLGKPLRFRKPLVYDVEVTWEPRTGVTLIATNWTLNSVLSASRLEDLLSSIQHEVAALWDVYVAAPRSTLTSDAFVLRRTLERHAYGTYSNRKWAQEHRQRFHNHHQKGGKSK